MFFFGGDISEPEKDEKSCLLALENLSRGGCGFTSVFLVGTGEFASLHVTRNAYTSQPLFYLPAHLIGCTFDLMRPVLFRLLVY